MKLKPKISFLVPHFGIIERGAENWTRELAQRLSNEFEITIFSRKKTAPFAKKACYMSAESWLVRAFCKFFPFPAHFQLDPNGIQNLSFSICCLPQLITGKYDLIFPVNGLWGALIARVIRLIKGTPFIYASKGGEEPPIARQRPNIYVCQTPYTQKWYKKHFPSLRTVQIPNGVDLKKFHPQNKKIMIPLEKPIFLCVAGLQKEKRIDLAIKAVARLKKGSLLVLGGGKLKKEISALGKKLLGKERFLLTKVPYDEISSYYVSVDVFTLPSWAEPFGTVYLEAMASGLPVVATNDERREYIIGKAGILCDPQNTEEYAQALKKAVEKDWGDLPREQAKKFDWEIIAEQYKRLFCRLLED